MSFPVETGESSRSSSRTWWICGLLMLATMLNYMDRQTVSLSVERRVWPQPRELWQYGGSVRLGLCFRLSPLRHDCGSLWRLLDLFRRGYRVVRRRVPYRLRKQLA